jgi:fumarate reductase subunit D
MTALKQIRWTAIVILVVGLGLAFGAGLVESEALKAEEGQFAHTAASLAGKLFTVASVLILIWATEWQRAKIAARLQKVEDELNSLKRAQTFPTAA